MRSLADCLTRGVQGGILKRTSVLGMKANGVAVRGRQVNSAPPKVRHVLRLAKLLLLACQAMQALSGAADLACLHAHALPLCAAAAICATRWLSLTTVLPTSPTTTQRPC